MDPLPCWLAALQHVALSLGTTDLATSLHHALFHGGTGGFVLKPAEMRDAVASGAVTGSHICSSTSRAADDRAKCWPPPRDKLYLATVDLISLVHLPKRSESRPQLLTGSRSLCHAYEPELSGTRMAPDRCEPSSPSIVLAVHGIGGFHAVSGSLPLTGRPHAEYRTSAVPHNGLNAPFGETVYCLAAEPQETFLRVSILDGGLEVAFETAILGRLRRGYRVFRLRCAQTGTRIELAFLFVRISTMTETNNEWKPLSEMRRKFITVAALAKLSARCSEERTSSQARESKVCSREPGHRKVQIRTSTVDHHAPKRAQRYASPDSEVHSTIPSPVEPTATSAKQTTCRVPVQAAVPLAPGSRESVVYVQAAAAI